MLFLIDKNQLFFQTLDNLADIPFQRIDLVPSEFEPVADFIEFERYQSEFILPSHFDRFIEFTVDKPLDACGDKSQRAQKEVRKKRGQSRREGKDNGGETQVFGEKLVQFFLQKGGIHGNVNRSEKLLRSVEHRHSDFIDPGLAVDNLKLFDRIGSQQLVKILHWREFLSHFEGIGMRRCNPGSVGHSQIENRVRVTAGGLKQRIQPRVGDQNVSDKE
jgi:hypothetical protein